MGGQMPRKEITIVIDDDFYNIQFLGDGLNLADLSFAWGKLTEYYINRVKALLPEDTIDKVKESTAKRFKEIWDGIKVDEPLPVPVPLKPVGEN